MGKFFYAGPDANKAKRVYKLKRNKLARFVRIISGHNSLSYFRSKVDNEVDPKCQFCECEDETFIHFVSECPRLRSYQTEKFQNDIISNDHMWSVDALISFSQLPGINEALEGPLEEAGWLSGHLNEERVSNDGNDDGEREAVERR